MLRIGSNIAAMQVQRRLAEVSYESSRSLERLSSGARINRASDDAAGLAIASALKSQARVYTQALRNGNDAISALSVQDAALSQLTDVVTRLKELATQASNGSFSRIQRLALDKEGAQLVEEFNRTVAATSFNGVSLLSGNTSSLGIQLGYGNDGRVNVTLNQGLRRSIGSGFIPGDYESVPGPGDIQTSALGDMNGDGYSDLVRVTQDNLIRIFFGSETGFSSALVGDVILTSGITNTPIDVVVGDLNGDGRNDLVVSDGGYSGALLQQADGSFIDGGGADVGSAKIGIELRGSGLRLRDINGDGKLDLIGSSADGFHQQVAFGDGSGNFSSTVESEISFSRQYELADFDGDGVLDLFTHNGDINVQLGRRDGTFGSAQSLLSGVNFFSSFAVGDVNYDGLLDIAINGASINLYHGQSDGTLGTANAIGSGGLRGTISILDLDGDGIVDILHSNGTSQLAYVRYGRGDGTFDVAESTGSYGRDIVTGDVNGDGVLDVFGMDDGNEIEYAVLNGSDYALGFGVKQESTTIKRLNLTTREEALSALSLLDDTLQRLAQDRGSLGASQSRIQAALSVVLARRDTGEGAASRILDIDVASESADLARRTILQQTAASLLGQANQAPALALRLLRT